MVTVCLVSIELDDHRRISVYKYCSKIKKVKQVKQAISYPQLNNNFNVLDTIIKSLDVTVFFKRTL